MIELSEKIGGRVYQLRFFMPMEPGHVFSYVVRLNNECVMIDAGYPSNDLLNPLINTLKAIPNCRVTTLFITHMHIDHTGLANDLRSKLGLSVAMHRRDYEQVIKMLSSDLITREFLELLQYYGVPETEVEMYRRVMNGISSRRRLSDVRPDIIIDGEEERIEGVRVLLTPGHSPGHVSIVVDEYGIAFTGDLILPTITTHVGLTAINPGNPLSDYLTSLLKIRSIGPRCLYPGHEGEICNVGSRISELIEHRVSRLCEVLNALRSNELTIFEVTKALKWMDNKGYADLDPMNRYMALTETAALIKYLESLGIVREGNYHRYEIVKEAPCDTQRLIPQLG
ncbi:MBL fold metallo-hydrolase [Vulcanisaeta sp. JCM 14467]|uniref:MBL fold metallo-hydrolase n=1 Tax=Vulcanisaeta sp. JCM 14467 TaxID=1295370 RepID=UPI0006D1A108|nr:MBL fold metallo-hydrolase [Vulcanisaeta sp. JCM 14467]